MSTKDFDPDILQDFLTESGELLEELERDLVDLEASPQDIDLLNQIFRSLHTIKGSASFLSLANLVAVAHCAESVLNIARSGDLLIGKPEMDLLLEAVDVLKVQFDELRGGSTDLIAASPRLIAQLNRLGNSVSHSDHELSTGSALDMQLRDESRFSGFECRRQRIQLDEGKLDLIEHMANDIKITLAQACICLDELASPDSREAACANLEELFEDIVKTIDFFEIDPILQIATVLDQSIDNIAHLSDDQIAQLTPRLKALCALIDEQTTELTNQVLVTWTLNTLYEQIEMLADGIDLPDAVLPDNADARDVLLACGLGMTGSGDSPETVDCSISTNRDAGATTPKKTIRVEVSRLESLMNLVGELVLEKNRVGAMAEDFAKSMIEHDLIEQMETTASTLDRITGDIQLAVMQTRMQPLEKIFSKYPRLIRDLETKTGKQISLEIEGGDTEVEKSIIEALSDPLIHLLRNSVDHGIELPSDREAAGKNPTGTIKLVAGHEGSHICLKIIDDGKGLDRAVISTKAVERGLATEKQLTPLHDEDVFRFIFEPGFSTVETVSDLSGRGVGMDVVRTNIESKLKGGITIESTKGKGTTITLAIPLTVAIMPAMMVAASEEIFAIPLANVSEIVSPTPDMLSKVGEVPVIHLRGAVYPLTSSQDIFDVPKHARQNEPFVIVIRFNQKIFGLSVTRVFGQQEIVIKPLDGIQRDAPISGATVRSDGGVSLILDIAELMRTSRNLRTSFTSNICPMD
tara:strand:+ start:30512 stop:32761 length:2250 start_codon:yes stop_codon:yes gene_type:complete